MDSLFIPYYVDISHLLPKNNRLFTKAELDYYLNDQKMTQNDIANKTGVNRCTVSEYKKLMGLKSANNGKVGQVPFGFKYVDGQLVMDQVEQLIISKMVELRKDNNSLADICNHLTKKGIPTKNGGVWHRNTVRNILKANV